MDQHTIVSLAALGIIMVSLGMYISYLIGKRTGAREYYNLLTKTNPEEDQIQ